MWVGARRRMIGARAAMLFVCAAALVTGGPASAQRLAYWLAKPGTNHVSLCPGTTQGEPLKIGRDFPPARNGEGDDDHWLLVAGLVTCADAGADYTYTVEFLNIGVNPSERASLSRETLSFDWIGLAVFRGAVNDQAIEWLYDDARPVHGVLKREDTRKLSFGNLTFRVPKRSVDSATHFTFYIVAEGLLWHVPVL